MTNADRARSALHALDPGCDRDTWVRVAMAAKAAGLTFEDFDSWSSTAPNYKGMADTRAVWRSIQEQGGIGPGTLFGLARDAGWEGPAAGSGPQVRRAARRVVPNRTADKHRATPAPKTIWSGAQPADADHGYIARKKGLPFGLRVYRGPLRVAGEAVDGWLLCPALDADGRLQTLQFIAPDPGSKKLNLPGRPLAGWFAVGGPVREGERCFLTEGLATAWSAHMATRRAAVVTFGAARFEAVARALRARYPGLRLTFVPDRGKESQVAALVRVFDGAWIELPPDKPTNYDLNDFHQDAGLAAVEALLANPKEPPQRFKLRTADELATLPPMRWRVRGVLPQEGLAALYGSPGSGKSFIAIDLLGAIADGREWFGHKVIAGPATLVCLEGEAGLVQRVQAYCERHGAASPYLRFISQPFELLQPDDVKDLAHAIRAAGGADGVVAIDTLNRAAPGIDENSSADMSRAIESGKALQRALGGLVLLVHHQGKDPTKGLRGHSSLNAAMDAVIEVSREADRREWKLVKAKDGSDGVSHPFRLVIVDLGADEHGEPVTSCVVEPEQGAGEAVRRLVPPKAGNQKAAWDSISERLCSATDYGKAGAPAGRPCIKLDAGVEATRKRLVCDSKRRTERATQAVQGLINRGLLMHADGWLWCA